MNVCLAAFLGLMVLVPIAAPVGTGLVRAGWVLVTTAAGALVLWRALRMGVIAYPDRIVVRNLGRDYSIDWADIAEIQAGRSDNITGAAKTIRVRRSDGTSVIARAASSYSASKVERWRDELLAARSSAL
jgi:hypothetical protein